MKKKKTNLCKTCVVNTHNTTNIYLSGKESRLTISDYIKRRKNVKSHFTHCQIYGASRLQISSKYIIERSLFAAVESCREYISHSLCSVTRTRKLSDSLCNRLPSYKSVYHLNEIQPHINSIFIHQFYINIIIYQFNFFMLYPCSPIIIFMCKMLYCCIFHQEVM